MNDHIRSLEKSLLALDKESIKRDLTVKEMKKKEHLTYEIYWAKFNELKTDFERLVITDVKELTDSLKTPLLEKNIVMQSETHIKNSRRYIGPDLPIYMVISISERSISLNRRWEKSPFLLIKGNHENGLIELYHCNQDLGYVSNILKKNALGNPIEQCLMDEYKFNLLKPHIEKWIKRNRNRILKNKN
jgi:hypothetical protein